MRTLELKGGFEWLNFTKAYHIPNGTASTILFSCPSEGEKRYSGRRVVIWDRFPCAGQAKGVSDYHGTPDAGPCAYVHRDSPQAARRFRDGFLKGKSAIAIARLCGKERNFTGEHLWARGYAVSTVGFELDQVQYFADDPRPPERAGASEHG